MPAALTRNKKAAVIYISERLPRRFPTIAQNLRAALRLGGAQLRQLSGTNSIWCRDFMPIPRNDGKWVAYIYNPNYLQSQYQNLITNWKSVRPRINPSKIIESGLILDGGNVIHRGRTAIMTDKVFAENQALKRRQVQARLRQAFNLNRLVIIPSEPNDMFGHADGMVRFVTNRSVLANDYMGSDHKFGDRLYRVLRRHHLKVIPFPYYPVNKTGPDQVPSAEGLYINFLQIAGLIICPAFGIKKQDEQAVKVLEDAFPKARVVPLECRTLALDGGVLNCVTWNGRKEDV